MRQIASLMAICLLVTALCLAGSQSTSSGGDMNDDHLNRDRFYASASEGGQSGGANAKRAVIFGVFAASDEQLEHVKYLVESIREFAGKFREAPVWVYVPADALAEEPEIRDRFAGLNVEVKGTIAPEESLQLYFARKVFAAADAETEAEKKAIVLAWLDEDTIVLKEPSDFMLPQGKVLGYRPVMHNVIGSLYSEPPNELWSRVFELMSVSDSSMFPMTTPADKQTIRPYFNAGLLVVRPERGILRGWAEQFPNLYQDSVLFATCMEDVKTRIFLHQMALVGAVLNQVKHEEMIEFSPDYNYPLFFERKFEALGVFNSLDVVTLRYDIYFREPDPDWPQRLDGPPEVIEWLKARFYRE